MSPRLTAHARREQILDVALEVFASHGFHGASMNDVADAVGVARSWPELADALPALRAHARQWAGELAEYPDLATQLVGFARSRL